MCSDFSPLSVTGPAMSSSQLPASRHTPCGHTAVVTVPSAAPVLEISPQNIVAFFIFIVARVCV
jgi:hypothetical protein